MVAVECSATCEEALYIGVAGRCDNVTGMCICPPGYGGADDFFKYDDCRVNELVQLAFHGVLLCVSCALFVMSLSGAVYLGVYWNYVKVPHGSGTPSSLSSNNAAMVVMTPQPRLGQTGDDNTPNSSSEEAATSVPVPQRRPSRQTKKQLLKRRRREHFSILSLLMIVAYAGSTLAYVVPYFLGSYRWMHLWYHDAALAMMVCSTFIALWFYFYVWYSNLPSLRLYGKLFGLQNNFVLEPKFVKVTTICRGIIITLATLTLFLILPMFNRDDEDFHILLFKIANWFGFVFALDFMVFILLLMRLMQKLFSQFEALNFVEPSTKTRASGVKRAFCKASKAIKQMQFTVVAIGIPACTIFALLATMESVRHNTYITSNLVIVCGNCAALAVMYFTIFTLRGPKVAEADRSE